MSDLIEKVAREIRVATLKTVMPEITDAEIDEIFRTRLVDYDPEARAAIAAVAECLRAKRHGCHDYSADFLEKKLEQPKGAAGAGR